MISPGETSPAGACALSVGGVEGSVGQLHRVDAPVPYLLVEGKGEGPFHAPSTHRRDGDGAAPLAGLPVALYPGVPGDVFAGAYGAAFELDGAAWGHRIDQQLENIPRLRVGRHPGEDIGGWGRAVYADIVCRVENAVDLAGQDGGAGVQRVDVAAA